MTAAPGSPAAAVRIVASLAVLCLVAVACGGGQTAESPGAPSEGGSAGADASISLGDVEPVTSAVAVDGTAILDPAVRTVDLASVNAVSVDGAVFTVAAAAAADLSPGTIFVVPGVAARRVLSAEAGDGLVELHTEQAPIDDVFAELDVTFDGEPDVSTLVWDGEPVAAAGAEPLASHQEVEDLEDPADAELPEDLTGESGMPGTIGTVGEAASAPLAVTTPAPGGGPGLRLATAPGRTGPCPPPALKDDVRRGDDEARDATSESDGEGNGDGSNDDASDPDADAEEQSIADHLRQASTKREQSFKTGSYTTTASYAVTPGCPTLAYRVTVQREGGIEVTGSMFGSLTAQRVSGGMSKDAAGSSGTAQVALSGDLTVSVVAQAHTAAAKPDGMKISYDIVKVDVPIMIGPVPFIVRVGVPLTLQVRLPGRGDILAVTILKLTCDGTVAIDGSDTPESICTAAPVAPYIAESLAPMAFVAAAGFKVGFGPGTVVGTKTIAFAGATATLSTSTGLSRSGTAAAPLIDCTRVDRSVQLNLGGEVDFSVVKLSTSTNVWTKSATDEFGRKCTVG